MAGRADAVCFGTLAQRSARSRRTIRAFLAATRDSCLRVFDVNFRQQYFDRPLVHDMLGLISVLKLSEEELPILAQPLGIAGDARAVVDELLRSYPLRLVALSRGRHGSYLCARDQRHEHPGYSVAVKDAVGAGDAFTAALVLGLLRGRSLETIGDAANRVAAFVCSCTGATPPLPDTLRAILA